jgi:hypothetical protein
VPPDNSDPNSGGWGTIRGSVPFTLDGNILTFSSPLSLISDHIAKGNTKGIFSYDLQVDQCGAQTFFSTGNESTRRKHQVKK